MTMNTKEMFVCPYWEAKRGTCIYNKKEAMEFLNSVGAIVKDGPRRDSVDPQKEWSSEDWERYHKMMDTLADGAGGLNLPTGLISCGEGDNGKNSCCSVREAEMNKGKNASKTSK